MGYYRNLLETPTKKTNISDKNLGIPKLESRGEGHSTFFFSGGGVRPGFPKCGSCELIIASEKGVL